MEVISPAPPGIQETITTGHTIRVNQKTVGRKTAHRPPKLARIGGPKATDIRVSKRRNRACARCLRRYARSTTDRVETLARPTRRRIIYMWRDHKNTLLPNVITRLRDRLQADKPLRVEQALEYFAAAATFKKGKKKTKQKKGFLAMMLSSDVRTLWARMATVNLARGIQNRFSKPGVYKLTDGMKRLSDIVLEEMFNSIYMKPPSRGSTNRKAKFMIEMADKIAVWIDEIVSESAERMLMMDFDEDDEVTGLHDGFADEFLNMMAGGEGVILIPPKPAYLKFRGDMADAFMILTDEMYKKGTSPLIAYGKFYQNHKEAADALRQTHSLEASNYSSQVAQAVNKDLTELAKDVTPQTLVEPMAAMVDICSNYLAQNAERNKLKGPAFHLLTTKMRQKQGDKLASKGKVIRNMGQGATMLLEAKSLEVDHEDPLLSLEIYNKLDKLVPTSTPHDIKCDMPVILDICSKYLSQAMIDLNERGPAFDLLIEELEKRGAEIFSIEHKYLETNQDVGHALKNAAGLAVDDPEISVSKRLAKKLHAIVDGVTPRTMQRDMNETIEMCSDYLSSYIRYRGAAKDILLKVLRKEPNKDLAQRNAYKMSQAEAVTEIETAPVLAAALPIKDIADEIKGKMTKAVDASFPPVPDSMRTAMKALIKDAAQQLSQNVALKSGAAGERYGANLTAAVIKSMGDKELVKYKDFKETYASAGVELQYAGSPLKVPKDPIGTELQQEIQSEFTTSVPTRMSPSMTASLSGNMDNAAQHLAARAKEKGDALDYLLACMNGKGDAPFGRLQGYLQTYAEAAERVENAQTLATEKVDKASYETANTKLKELIDESPNSAIEDAMPEIIEDVAKFLASPPPETPDEKKRMLREFLAKKGIVPLTAEGMYKMTYQDAADDVLRAPVGVWKSHDDSEQQSNARKLADALPDEQKKEFLKEQIYEGAAFITDAVKGRGDALQAIYDCSKKEGNKIFLDVGTAQVTYEEAADMLKDAQNLVPDRAPPGVADKAEKLIRQMNPKAPTPLGQAHMDDTSRIAAKFVAGELAKQAGMVPGQIGEDQKLAPITELAKSKDETAYIGRETDEQRRRRLSIERKLGRPETEEEYKKRVAQEALGRPETDEERKRRLEIEKRLGRPETPEEMRSRIDAEKKLGRPETEEEYKKRMAEHAKGVSAGRAGSLKETEAQQKARIEAEKLLGRPETEAERQRRLEIEKRLGRPETPEELRARINAEKKLGRPETEEEIKKRMAEVNFKKYGAESDGQKQARLAAETALGRPETSEERKRRLDIEKRLGRPETPEEIRARMAAEKKLGRPETEEEMKKRVAEEDFKKYGAETDAQKQAKLAAETALGRPETAEERKRRLENEKRLGRPETPEEMRARIEAEKKLGRPETEEEFRKRMGVQAKGVSAGGAGSLKETEAKQKARIEAEKLLGRPETVAERQRRLDIEKRLGRPETPEELRARIEAEKKLGRPETEEEMKKRMAEENFKKYGAETDTQKQARVAAEKELGRPETLEERKRRLETEKRLGRPETPEEMRARIEAEKKLGRPETEEEYRKRMGEQAKGVSAGGAGSLRETEAQQKARIEAEKLLGRPETEAERQRRLDIEHRLGRPETPEELRARIAAGKKLGRPETEEEMKKRMAEENFKKYGAETDAQKQARIAAEKALGRPETAEERKRRLEIEKRLGRPETPEEMRARIEAEKKLGRPETEEEYRKRMGEQAKGVSAGGAGSLRETEAQQKARIEAEKLLGRPETEAERQRRLDIEKRLGRPETPEELRARIAAEKKLGRPETEEEMKKRMAEENFKKYGAETDAQKQARIAAEKALGRPETAEERKRRLEIEKRLGRPETPEEMRARIEAEKKLGRPETEEEFRKRMGVQAKVLSAGGAGSLKETEAQQKARIEAEKLLGRPETEAERQRRLDIEKRLGRPETPEELRARIEVETLLGRPETEAERQRRLQIDKRLGRPETPEELRARIEAEKRLGRPETEEEMKRRIAEEDFKKYGAETDGQKQARLAAEKALGRPETTEERQRRLEIERKLGRAETPEERRRRLSVERRLGRPERDAEYRARIAAEKLLGRAETEAERKERLQIEARLGRPETEEEYCQRMGAAIGSGEDPEKEAAISVLHKQLNSKRKIMFYEQPKTKLTHKDASEWLKRAPLKVERSEKESGDTERLNKKFERKLCVLMATATPEHMQDVMQDVIIESAQKLAEYFVAKNYRALAADALIAGMQRRGNEILIETNGVAETTFFAAQRLKLTKSLEAKEPCAYLSYKLLKSFEDVVKCNTMSRKLLGKMKDHINIAADYLSQYVTKPNPQIEAYVALLQEMETAGDRILVEGEIQKSFKDAAAYLRRLTTFDDQLGRSNSVMQSKIQNKLGHLMSSVTNPGYGASDMSRAISESAKLVVSYIMFQVERTQALKEVMHQMDRQGDNVLLRHGVVRKTYKEGADALQGKNTDQIVVDYADPVAARKMQIKIRKLMIGKSPKFELIMDEVIENAASYLAVAFLQPHTIRVCKCVKSVFVQCELWCEEILRRVAQPCCTCSRHVSAQALTELAPDAETRLRVSPTNTHAFAPGLDIHISQCPATDRAGVSTSCPAINPCPGLDHTARRSNTSTATYMVHTTTRDRDIRHEAPTRLRDANLDSSENTSDAIARTWSPMNQPLSPLTSRVRRHVTFADLQDLPEFTASSTNESTDFDAGASSLTSPSEVSHHAEDSTIPPFPQTHIVMFVNAHTEEAGPSGSNITTQSKPRLKLTGRWNRASNALKALQSLQTASTSKTLQSSVHHYGKCISQKSRTSLALEHYIMPETPSRRSNFPSVTTDQISDWHSMIVSLMWNVQEWCNWLQTIVDQALAYSTTQPDQDWIGFQKKVTTEAVQWRKYNIFTRKLMLRLALRYRDKRIVSPERGTEKTNIYIECQRELLEIIDVFCTWTRWLLFVIKESETVDQAEDSDVPLERLRWSRFKTLVQNNAEVWAEYTEKLALFWNKYDTILSEWAPSRQRLGPVWVVSPCGAVPSGAVAAGYHGEELVWVARTTHRSEVVPAALVPSKQCCLVYANGAVHHYTQYQVLCNARVAWVPWRAGASMCERAVRVAGGVHAGRVHFRGSHLLGAVRAPEHRLHVVIFGRDIAFNCYELLVVDDANAIDDTSIADSSV